MKAEKRNHLWLASICFILAGLLVVVHARQVGAQDKPPSTPPVNKQVIKSTGGSSMDKPPTNPPQEMEGEQASPLNAGDMYPPTNPPATEQSAEGEEATGSINIPLSYGRTTGEVQKEPSANAQKPTYEIKPKQGNSTFDKPKQTISKEQLVPWKSPNIYIIQQPNEQRRGYSDHESRKDDTEEISRYTPPADIEQRLKSIPQLPSNIKEYLENKYVHLDDLPNVMLQMTPYGQQIKTLGLSGEIIPKDNIKVAKFNKALENSSREKRASALAMAFLEEETDLLGIVDMNEIKMTKITTSTNIDGTHTYTHLYYNRYIGNIRLENAYIQFTIWPAELVKQGVEAIRDVSAEVVFVTPDFYQAVAKETLTKKQVIKIIERDLAPPEKKSAVRIAKIDKVAISSPPYVIYKVGAYSEYEHGWNYRVDAFTGEILDKRDARQFIR